MTFGKFIKRSYALRRGSDRSSISVLEGLEPRRLMTAVTATPYYGTPITLPARIEAESFDKGGEGVAFHTSNPQNYTNNLFRADRPSIENSTDAGGGYDLAFTHTGDFFSYTVNVATPGPYDLSVCVANPAAGGMFHVEVDGVNLSGEMVIPATADWQTFTTLTKSSVTLSAGNHSVKLVMDGANSSGFTGNFNWLQFTNTPALSTTPPTTPTNPTIPPITSPFGGIATKIPGKIEAENFDLGGEGVAFHSSNTQNYTNHLYRADGPSIESTGDTLGGYDLGYTHTGDYFQYTVTLAETGTYDLSVRAANPAAGGAFHVEVDGVNVTGTVAITPTIDWLTYESLTTPSIALTAGAHVVKLVMDGANAYGFTGNFNYLQFSARPTTSPSTTGPFTGTAVPILSTGTSTVEAENFDLGGDGVGFHTSNTHNYNNDDYRTGNVTIQSLVFASNGAIVAYTRAGDYYNYTINVAVTGNYDLSTQLTEINAGALFHLEVDGTPISGELAVPRMANWQTYTSVTTPSVHLTAGTHILKLSMDTADPYGFVGNYDSIRFTSSAV